MDRCALAAEPKRRGRTSVSAPRSLAVESFDALPAGVSELWRRAEPHLQFDQTLGWCERLARHAREPGEECRIVCAGDGRIGAILPLRVETGGRVFATRFARALANYYCSLYAPITAEPDGGEAALPGLIDAVRASRPAVQAIDLNPLSSDAAPALAAALERAGWSTETYFRFGNWYLEVEGRSFDAYFAGLASQVRNTVRRKEKKLRAAQGFEMGIATAGEELERALGDYERIYASSWKHAEPHPEFVPSIVRHLGERGWMRLGWVRLEGEPIAAQIWVVKDGIASIFKLAYDERHAQLSAGSVLTAHLMRHAIDADRVRIVDYLTGDDAYKREWMSHRRERVGVRAYLRASARGRLALAARAARASLKRVLRRAETPAASR